MTDLPLNHRGDYKSNFSFKDDFEVPRSLHGGGGLVGGNPNLAVPGNFQLPVAFPFPAHSFMPPMAAPQPAPPSSGSSHSSEGSASSQQTWSFEEQFKQVRQVMCSFFIHLS